MRSTFLAFCLLVVAVWVAGPAWADANWEFTTSGTANYNLADNWTLLEQVGGTGKWVLTDPPVHGIPANVAGSASNAVDYIRNGATVTMVNSMPNVAGIHIGTAGDVTKDAGGTLLSRPGSTLEVRSGGAITQSSYGGVGYPSPVGSTVGASYDGTLNIKGGQVTIYGGAIIGAQGVTNPGGSLPLVPYQGTGRLNMSSGGLSMAWGGTLLSIGSGRSSDALGNRVLGIATFSGGQVDVAQDSGILVGVNGGRGSMVVKETDPNVPMVINNTQGEFTIGSSGYSTSTGYKERSQGTYIQDGGYVSAGGVGGFDVGTGHADGLAVLNGGSFILTADGECRVGMGANRSNPMGGRFVTTGNGTLVVNGGYFQSNNTRTKFIVGRGDPYDSQYYGTGVGVFQINGGVVRFYRGGTDLDNSLEFGNNGSGDQSLQTYSYGELDVLGGSLLVDKRVLFAKNASCTGVFRVSKNAYVELGWLGLWEPNVDPPVTTGVVKMIVDVTQTGNSLVNVAQDLWLKGTLDVQTYNWRPREGDKFKIIDLDTYLSEISGDFDTFTSSITNGLPHQDPNDPNSPILSAFLGTGIASDPSYGEPNAGYYVTFRGFTSGDANGDHAVNGGDLALMGGNWAQSGKGWGQGNFNGDPSGLVDGGDLALLGGNWLWTKPAAPEPAPLPEPASLALLTAGGAVLIRRKRR